MQWTTWMKSRREKAISLTCKTKLTAMWAAFLVVAVIGMTFKYDVLVGIGVALGAIGGFALNESMYDYVEEDEEDEEEKS